MGGAVPLTVGSGRCSEGYGTVTRRRTQGDTRNASWTFQRNVGVTGAWTKQFLAGLELLQAVLRKSEQGLARQRQLIEDLRCDGHRTIEAEDVLLRFETAYQVPLAKLNALRGEGVTG